MPTPEQKKPQLRDILDFTQIENVLRHFSVVTGLDAAFYNSKGREIIAKREKHSICGAAKGCAKCGKYISYGGEKSLELNEPYIYNCGCGLVMCSSPIVYNGELIGSIACGPVMLWDADEMAVAEITEKTRDMKLPSGEILSEKAASFLPSIPSLDCVNITSAAQILFIMVNSLTRKHSDYQKQRQKVTELALERKVREARLRKLEDRKALLKYPAETEKELIAFVQSGNKQQATNLLNILLSDIFSIAEGNIDTIRVRVFELVAFLSRAAVDSGAPLHEVNRITKETFEICDEKTDFERLCQLTTGAMEGFIDTVYRNRDNIKTSYHLTRAIDYIRSNYGAELTLKNVAESVYVSEYYLSHLFRKEMDMTFSDYVTHVRIAKAKELLTDHIARIQEVAENTGFNDPNYFAKIFKKYTGISPSAYQGFFK
jgi:two-component system response regulator YesN